MMNSPSYSSQQAARSCGIRSSIYAAILLGCGLVALPLAAQTSASVSINSSSAMGSVPSQGGYGVGSSVYDNYMTNQGVGPALKTGGFNAIRYPGGSYADIFNFIGVVAVAIYGSNTTNNGPGNTSTAANWVQYANITNNEGILYWEIGNEI